MREMKVLDANSFASSSVPVHLARGAVGLTLLIAAFALIPAVGLVALVLAPLGIVFLRGCPTCWAIGLTATISRGRLDRSCADDDACRLTRSDHAGTAVAARH